MVGWRLRSSSHFLFEDLIFWKIWKYVNYTISLKIAAAFTWRRVARYMLSGVSFKIIEDHGDILYPVHFFSLRWAEREIA